MKKVWTIVLVTVLCITVLTGCKSDADMSDNTGSEAESQVVSEEMSENVSEENTESLSGENSEELEEEVADYSAESVMAKIDEMIAACPHDDPEQIKAAVIGVNLEYISDEDLTILMETYGYSLEELSDLFDAYMGQYLHHIWLTNRWNIGVGEIMDTMNEEQDLLQYRANIAGMYIGQEESKMMVDLIVTSICENEGESIMPYAFPNEYELTDVCPYNYQSEELSENTRLIINYILIHNEASHFNNVPELVEVLSGPLPYDAKLKAQ